MGRSAVADAPGITIHIIARLREHKGLAPRGILSCREAGGGELSLVSKRKGLFALVFRERSGEEHMLPVPSWNAVPEDTLIHLSMGIGVLGRRLAMIRLNVNGRTLVETPIAVAIDPHASWRERLGRAGSGRAAAADLNVYEVRRIDMFLGSLWEQRLRDVYAGRWSLPGAAIPGEPALSSVMPGAATFIVPPASGGASVIGWETVSPNVSPVWESA